MGCSNFKVLDLVIARLVSLRWQQGEWAPPESLDRKVAAVRSNSLCISVVTKAELLSGVERKGHPPKLAALVSQLLQKLPSLPWDDECARTYAHVRAKLELEGKPIGNLDLLIAAHALAVDVTLVTNNEQHFKNIPGSKLDNWS